MDPEQFFSLRMDRNGVQYIIYKKILFCSQIILKRGAFLLNIRYLQSNYLKVSNITNYSGVEAGELDVSCKLFETLTGSRPLFSI